MEKEARKKKSLRWYGREIRKNRDNYLMVAPYGRDFHRVHGDPGGAGHCDELHLFQPAGAAPVPGLFNYMRLFLDDDVFWLSMKNTLIFALLTGPLSYFLCLVFAWLINELPVRARNLFTLVFYAPSISGALYVIWSFIFSGDAYGMANGLLMQLGVINEPILWLTDPRYDLGIVIVVQLWLSLGTSFLAFIAGLQGVDRSLYEAGAIDGIRQPVPGVRQDHHPGHRAVAALFRGHADKLLLLGGPDLHGADRLSQHRLFHEHHRHAHPGLRHPAV